MEVLTATAKSTGTGLSILLSLTQAATSRIARPAARLGVSMHLVGTNRARCMFALSI